MHLTRVIPLLRMRGVEVEVCTLDSGGSLATAMAAQARVHTTAYATRRDGSNTAALLRTVRDIRRLVRRGGFDIVHTHLYWADVLGTIGAAAALCPRRIISRRAMNHARFAPGGGRAALDALSTLLATEVVANSRAALDDAAAAGHLPRHRTVIHNGIDPRSYAPAAPRDTGPLRLLSVGTLSAVKGHEHAIRALRLVRAGGVDAELTMVGGGPEQERLRRLAEPDRAAVHFAGHHADPRAFLAQADVFVMPSVEGFSNALLEAMASGLPVIGVSTGGTAEAVIDGEGGLLVPPADPIAMARAIEALASSRERLRAMGAANRARVVSHFSLEVCADRLAAWYLDGPHGEGGQRR